MNKIFKSLSLLAVISLFGAFYKAQTIWAAPAPIDYEFLIYRSLDDRLVADIIASNHCITSGYFQLCKSAGIAIRVNRHRLIEQIYLYADGGSDFTAFTGELPFGISRDDTMSMVEKKLGYPKVPQVPQFGWEPGLPDEASTPDHHHYWATYENYDLTIIYNSPSDQDKNASIHMILINIDSQTPFRGRIYLC